MHSLLRFEIQPFHTQHILSYVYVFYVINNMIEMAIFVWIMKYTGNADDGRIDEPSHITLPLSQPRCIANWWTYTSANWFTFCTGKICTLCSSTTWIHCTSTTRTHCTCTTWSFCTSKWWTFSAANYSPISRAMVCIIMLLYAFEMELFVNKCIGSLMMDTHTQLVHYPMMVCLRLTLLQIQWSWCIFVT